MSTSLTAHEAACESLSLGATWDNPAAGTLSLARSLRNDDDSSRWQCLQVARLPCSMLIVSA
jgi:hypothetical protein